MSGTMGEKLVLDLETQRGIPGTVTENNQWSMPSPELPRIAPFSNRLRRLSNGC